MSAAVIKAIRSALGAGEMSDCDVLFCPEREPGASERALDEGEEGAEQRKRPRLAETAPPIFGAPLPAHTLLLSLASDVFRAQVDKLRASTGAEASSSSASRRPQLRVFVNSEAEAAFARAAIGYAYTGQVAAVGIREALEVRRQAGYLQITGCAAACDGLLMGLLTAGKAKVGVVPAPSSAVVELTECWALLPVDDPSFARVLAAAKEALVQHFGDALAALNTPSLRQQLLQLPAAAVEVLLGSAEFGMDTEDSVLLLLATWIKANHSQTDAATRKRLCRLVQLRRPYLTAVLPALAADYETGAGGPPGAWFPISVAEACFIAAVAAVPAGREKEETLRVGNQLYDTQSPWYRTWPRRQCLSAPGRTFEWAISERELQEGLGRLKPGRDVEVWTSFAGDGRLCASGFEWKVTVKHAATSAAVFMRCAMPAAYDVPGSRLGSGSKAAAAVGLDARLAVHSWGGGTRQDAHTITFETFHNYFGTGGLNEWWRIPPLPLAQPQPAGGVEVLAGWAAYVHDGRLTGTLTLLQPRP